MIFRQLFDQTSSTYTYLLADELSREAVLIDPVQEQLPAYRQLLADLSLNLVMALDTHVHADHITALGDLREALGCRSMMGEQSGVDCVSETFADGQVLRFGRYHLQALYTPGHTDDSYCFLLQANGQAMVFTGDTLLIRGTGRTDFQNGDAARQYHSLFERLLTLPGETRVYPAHDYKGWTASTIAEEKACNPRLQVAGQAEYVALMDALDLPDPKMMDVAVPANQSCGQDSTA
ncbi:MAG: MBL fold metallo-hydrolase [Alcanivoracaceae bacterium]